MPTQHNPDYTLNLSIARSILEVRGNIFDGIFLRIGTKLYFILHSAMHFERRFLTTMHCEFMRFIVVFEVLIK